VGSVAPRNPNDGGYGAHGKISSLYSDQIAQMGRLGSSSERRSTPAEPFDCRWVCARFLTVLASVK
jgi:hypothetical protein